VCVVLLFLNAKRATGRCRTTIVPLPHEEGRFGFTTANRITFVSQSRRKRDRNLQKLACFVAKSKTSVGSKFNKRYVSSVGSRWKISMFRRLPRADGRCCFKKKTAAATSGSLSGTVVADIHVSVPALCLVERQQHLHCHVTTPHRATGRRSTTVIVPLPHEEGRSLCHREAPHHHCRLVL
jgi:hypothetical protein